MGDVGVVADEFRVHVVSEGDPIAPLGKHGPTGLRDSKVDMIPTLTRASIRFRISGFSQEDPDNRAVDRRARTQ